MVNLEGTGWIDTPEAQEAFRMGRDAALKQVADWHLEVARHDESGLEYSSLVGIPISNSAELDLSSRTHRWLALETLKLIAQKEGENDG